MDQVVIEAMRQRLAQFGIEDIEQGYYGTKPIRLSPGVLLQRIEGNCPVQAYGTIDDRTFYFRARYDEWQLGVGDNETQAIDATMYITLPVGLWACEKDYGDGFDAGWMPKIEALVFICQAADQYRADMQVTG